MPLSRALPRPVPRPLVVLGSLFVVVHLGAVVFLALSAPSGPWLSPFGPSQALGPTFAARLGELATSYLQPLRMSHNYHFQSNRVDGAEVQFEVVLRDAEGNAVGAPLRFPAKNDNPWVRYRHSLLAQGLANDAPVQVARGEEIPARGQAMEKVTLWKPAGPKKLVQAEVDKHLVKDLLKDMPREAQLMKPSDWSLVLAQSYARYLCRSHDAVAADVRRDSRDAVSPALLFVPDDNVPPGTFDSLESQFEEYRREQ